MRTPKSAEASIISREHLTRLLLENLERTFSSEGASGALSAMEQLFLKLDEAALREYAYMRGVTTEHEFETELPDTQRPEPATPSGIEQ